MTILTTALISFNGGFYEGLDDDGECTARATLHDDGSITFADIDLGEPKRHLLQYVPEIKIGRDRMFGHPCKMVIVSLRETMLEIARDELLGMMDLPAEQEEALECKVAQFIAAELQPARVSGEAHRRAA